MRKRGEREEEREEEDLPEIGKLMTFYIHINCVSLVFCCCRIPQANCSCLSDMLHPVQSCSVLLCSALFCSILFWKHFRHYQRSLHLSTKLLSPRAAYNLLKSLRRSFSLLSESLPFTFSIWQKLAYAQCTHIPTAATVLGPITSPYHQSLSAVPITGSVVSPIGGEIAKSTRS